MVRKVGLPGILNWRGAVAPGVQIFDEVSLHKLGSMCPLEELLSERTQEPKTTLAPLSQERISKPLRVNGDSH